MKVAAKTEEMARQAQELKDIERQLREGKQAAMKKSHKVVNENKEQAKLAKRADETRRKHALKVEEDSKWKEKETCMRKEQERQAKQAAEAEALERMMEEELLDLGGILRQQMELAKIERLAMEGQAKEGQAKDAIKEQKREMEQLVRAKEDEEQGLAQSRAQACRVKHRLSRRNSKNENLNNMTMRFWTESVKCEWTKICLILKSLQMLFKRHKQPPNKDASKRPSVKPRRNERNRTKRPMMTSNENKRPCDHSKRWDKIIKKTHCQQQHVQTPLVWSMQLCYVDERVQLSRFEIHHERASRESVSLWCQNWQHS
jgi:hypothetical protein